MDFQWPQCSAILQTTPVVVRSLLQGIPTVWERLNYGENTWSPLEILGHLIHGERTDWLARVKWILEHGETKPIAKFDRKGHESFCANATIAELLEVFDEVRRSNLAEVNALSLTEQDFAKRGLHPVFGPVTLRQLLSTWAVHDLNHIAQMCKAMAFQYKDAVGPWQAYLSILAPPAPR